MALETWRENTSESSQTDSSLNHTPNSALTRLPEKEQSEIVHVTRHIDKEQSEIVHVHRRDCVEQDEYSGGCVDSGEFSCCRCMDRNLARPVFYVKGQSTENEDSASPEGTHQKRMGCFTARGDSDCCAVEHTAKHCCKLKMKDSVRCQTNKGDAKRTIHAAAEQPMKSARCAQSECDQTLMDFSAGKAESVRVSVGENVEMEESIGSQMEVEGFILEKGKTGETTGSEGGVETKLKKSCQMVFQQFGAVELRSLFIKDRDGKDTCFADLGMWLYRVIVADACIK